MSRNQDRIPEAVRYHETYTYIFLEDAQRTLEAQEGFRPEPYLDSLGHETVGFGTKLPLAASEVERVKRYRSYIFASGGGLYPLSEVEAREYLLKPRLETIFMEVDRRAHQQHSVLVPALPVNVKIGLALMSYQLGAGGCLRFKKMWSALRECRWDDAALECRLSRWHAQTPGRAEAVARLFRTP